MACPGLAPGLACPGLACPGLACPNVAVDLGHLRANLRDLLVHARTRCRHAGQPAATIGNLANEQLQLVLVTLERGPRLRQAMVDCAEPLWQALGEALPERGQRTLGAVHLLLALLQQHLTCKHGVLIGQKGLQKTRCHGFELLAEPLWMGAFELELEEIRTDQLDVQLLAEIAPPRREIGVAARWIGAQVTEHVAEHAIALQQCLQARYAVLDAAGGRTDTLSGKGIGCPGLLQQHQRRRHVGARTELPPEQAQRQHDEQWQRQQQPAPPRGENERLDDVQELAVHARSPLGLPDATPPPTTTGRHAIP